jgi:hypothetical protein
MTAATRPLIGSAPTRPSFTSRFNACASAFDIGTSRYRMERSGSLLDGVCSRCHMPTNYVDNVPLHNVTVDAATGLEHGVLDVRFNPTSDNATGLAFAERDGQLRNTDSGKAGVVCMICHSLAETRNTPYHNQAKSLTKNGYTPALGTQSRAELLGAADRDITEVPDQSNSNLGYGVGGGAYRRSPHAIAFPERLGRSRRLRAAGPTGTERVFKRPASRSRWSRRSTRVSPVLATRAEFCSTCHDVTNL